MKQTISSIANMFEIKSNVKEVGHATIQYRLQPVRQPVTARIWLGLSASQ